MNELVQYIKSLEAAGQLGKVRDIGNGVEVEIIREGWQGKEHSFRIFPGWMIYRVSNDEVYLLTKERFQELVERSKKSNELVIAPIY